MNVKPEWVILNFFFIGFLGEKALKYKFTMSYGVNYAPPKFIHGSLTTHPIPQNVTVFEDKV